MTVLTRPRPVFQTSTPARAVRVGPVVTVVFEDRHALWLRMQEARRFGSKETVQRELDWYRQRMPEAGRWPAAVWLDRRATASRAALLAGRIELVSSAGHVVPAELLPQRHADRLGGLIGWIEFRYDPAFDAAFAATGLRWRLRIGADGYTFESAPLIRTRDGFVSANGDE